MSLIKMLARHWLMVFVAVLALASPFMVSVVSTTTASAHGCTRTAGYFKNKLDDILVANPSFHIPFPANQAPYSNGSQAQNYAHAIAILNYDPNMDGVATANDPESKLARAVLVAELNDHNGVDAPAIVIATQNLGLTFLHTHPYGSVLSASDAQLIIGWASLLDDYANGVIGPGHCPD